MQIEKIKVLKEDERGIVYRCDPVNYTARKKGTISADHTHEEKETIYLVEGKVELTIGKGIQNVESPAKFLILKNEYHKLIVQTDIKPIRV